MSAVDQASQLVDGLEDQLDDVAVEGSSFLRAASKTFSILCVKMLIPSKPEHGREAFEAVGGTEHFVEQFLVARWAGLIVGAADPLVELQKVLVEAVEQLSRLVEEIAEQASKQSLRRMAWGSLMGKSVYGAGLRWSQG